MVINLIIILILLIASFFDLKTFEVPLWLQLLLALVICITTPISKWIVPILIFIIYVIASTILPPIGGADIKIITLLMIKYQMMSCLIICIASIIGMVFIISSNKKKIPFTPCITLGVIICQILSSYLPI